MTRTRWLITGFWLFVAAMLVWQCQSGQLQVLHKEAPGPAAGTRYIFTPPPASALPAAPLAPVSTVRQTAFVVHPSTPGVGSFTCDITLRNDGDRTARGVQVHVRPYRGARSGNDSLGHVPYHFLSETDPTSQYGTWLTFPDLAPGQSATQSTVFYDHTNVNPGYNPNPEITFENAP